MFCAGAGSLYPLLMPAMAVPAGVSQVEVEVIVLIAGAWRLDWDLGRDPWYQGEQECRILIWYDTDQAQGVAAVAVSTRHIRT